MKSCECENPEGDGEGTCLGCGGAIRYKVREYDMTRQFVIHIDDLNAALSIPKTKTVTKIEIGKLSAVVTVERK